MNLIGFKQLSYGGALAIAALMPFGCGTTSPTLRHQRVSGFDAAKYRDYHLLNHPVATLPDFNRSLEQAVHNRLAKSGYRSVAKDHARSFISVKILLSDEVTVFPFGDAFATDTVDSTDMRDKDLQKTALVTLQDAETLQIVWAGWSQMKVSSRETYEAALQSILSILRKLPDVPRSQ